MNGKIVVFGCGYAGTRIARLFAQAGREVTGVTHSAESAHRLSGEPFSAIGCDVTDRENLSHAKALADADVAIYAVSSGQGGAEAYRHIYLDGLRNVIEICRPGRILFAGSTSVYAQSDGSRVTEESPAEPDRETGRILREAEDLALANGGWAARLAGIYGPGRSVYLRKFLNGEAVIEGDGSRIVNQIHADDAANGLFFMVERQMAPGIYNVCDDMPLSLTELYTILAEHFGRPMPPHGPVHADRKRGWTSKRVSNAKLREHGWKPQFPDFKSALQMQPELTRRAD